MEAQTNALEVIRAGYADGETVADIAKRLKVSRNSVIGKAFRAGLSHPHPRSKGKKKKTARDMAIARCVVNGISISAMAAIHSISRYHMWEIVNYYCRCVHRGSRYRASRWEWRPEYADHAQ
jgi:DNA-binding CsgD family transcriptional regulator